MQSWRAMSGLVVLMHPEAMLMIVASVNTEIHADVHSLGCHMKLNWCLWAVLGLPLSSHGL